MSNMGNAAASQGVFQRYRILVIGIVVFALGIAMFLAASIYRQPVSLCKYPNVGEFIPGTMITIECPVVRDLGQDLIFRAVIYSQGSPTIIGVPAHAEIRDPDNRVLHNVNFDEGKLVLYVKPELRGTYTATVTSLEDRGDRVALGTPRIHYAFGYLSSLTYSDVYNPVGTALEMMVVLGNVVYVAGIAIVIYGAVKVTRKKKV